MSETISYIAEAVAPYFTAKDSKLISLLADFKSLEQANDALFDLTAVHHFFPDTQSWNNFHQIVTSARGNEQQREARQWGDFQTSPRLVAQVCHYLNQENVSPEIIIEPTYGEGNFIRGALKAFANLKSVYGVEIQEKYAWRLKAALLSEALLGRRNTVQINLFRDDIFRHEFPRSIREHPNVLILGNPPWVTNAEMGGLDAHNLPIKKNIKSLAGLAALTGKSNFDLAEFVLLRMLDVFGEAEGMIALLCKNTVIKNFIEMLPQHHYRVSNIRAFQIDAARDFGAAVEASLLVMDIGHSKAVKDISSICKVASLDEPSFLIRRFGWTNQKFVSNMDHYQTSSDLDGKSLLVWRQGIKHDCARIMELDRKDGSLVNGNGELVDIEESCFYDLLKGSDLRGQVVDKVRKQIIITQSRIGEDTAHLQTAAPKLWAYLNENQEHFAQRRSSIYRGKPRFSIFGVGDYSFHPYKVAISGLYKKPCFCLVLPINKRPIMLDDTCYFIGFDNYEDALLTASLLNTPSVTRFLEGIVFSDAKRPYTKDILMRIDLQTVASRQSLDTLRLFWTERNNDFEWNISEERFEQYKEFLAQGVHPHKIYQYALEI